MDLNRILRQQQQRLYYPRYFRGILSVLWLTLLINIALVPVLLVFYFSQNNPLYYANNFDGQVAAISPIQDYVYQEPAQPASTPAQPASTPAQP